MNIREAVDKFNNNVLYFLTAKKSGRKIKVSGRINRCT